MAVTEEVVEETAASVATAAVVASVRAVTREIAEPRRRSTGTIPKDNIFTLEPTMSTQLRKRKRAKNLDEREE